MQCHLGVEHWLINGNTIVENSITGTFGMLTHVFLNVRTWMKSTDSTFRLPWCKLNLEIGQALKETDDKY